MAEIFLKTLPFFMLIGCGWLAGKSRFFTPEATAWLTKFVFYFALSAMLLRFSAGLDMASLFDPKLVLAYLSGSVAIWALGMAVARWRGLGLADAAMEAHCCMTGNTGFLGIPMLVALLGPPAIGPVMLILTLDMIVFSTLITVLIGASRHGRVSGKMLLSVLLGILRNPMIVSMALGLIWSGLHLPVPGPVDEFLTLLGSAATPGALFAIGASLSATAAAEIRPAVWVSFAKLVLHPVAVGLSAFWIFSTDPFASGVMIAAAALPVAGNVYILAQYFAVGTQRVSTAILISTIASIVTVPLVLHWITKG